MTPCRAPPRMAIEPRPDRGTKRNCSPRSRPSVVASSPARKRLLGFPRPAGRPLRRRTVVQPAGTATLRRACVPWCSRTCRCRPGLSSISRSGRAGQESSGCSLQVVACPGRATHLSPRSTVPIQVTARRVGLWTGAPRSRASVSRQQCRSCGHAARYE